MVMRHFGHGVGHLKYERQQESDTKMAEVESDDTTDTADIEEDSEDGVDDEDAGPYLENEEVGNSESDIEDIGHDHDDEGGSEIDVSDRDSNSDSGDSDGDEDGYGSF